MDINETLSRFLDGRTTPEEEDRLAEYFRHADPLPDSLKPYRDMFAYFDAGMPAGSLPEFDAVPAKPKRQHRLIAIWSAAVTAAAAAAALLIMWPTADRNDNHLNSGDNTISIADASAKAAASAYVPSDDSTKVKNPNKPTEPAPSQRDSRFVRQRYDIATPKLLIAANTDNATDDTADHTGSADNTPARKTEDLTHARPATSQESMIADCHSVDADQRQLEDEIADIRRMVNEARQNVMASESFVDEYK